MCKHISLKLVKLWGLVASKALGAELLSRLGGPNQAGYSGDFPLKWFNSEGHDGGGEKEGQEHILL